MSRQNAYTRVTVAILVFQLHVQRQKKYIQVTFKRVKEFYHVGVEAAL